MPVYPVAARTASCSSPGCWCHDRVPRYPSDLTDAQWAGLEPRAREVMAELVVAAARPMVHDLGAVCDAIAYVTRNGIEWRGRPARVPPRGGGGACFRRGGRPGARWGRGRPRPAAPRARTGAAPHTP